jgi:hypothetical protein
MIQILCGQDCRNYTRGRVKKVEQADHRLVLLFAICAQVEKQGAKRLKKEHSDLGIFLKKTVSHHAVK